jgi:hypothetical protein
VKRASLVKVASYTPSFYALKRNLLALNPKVESLLDSMLILRPKFSQYHKSHASGTKDYTDNQDYGEH